MSFTRSMAADFAPRGIRVNALAPGTVDTDMVRNTGPGPPRTWRRPATWARRARRRDGRAGAVPRVRRGELHDRPGADRRRRPRSALRPGALSTLGDMARIDVPEGPGGDAEMIWTLRPEMAGMVERMIGTVYGRSILPAEEREVARMRIAQLNDCSACSVFRAPSVVAAGVPEAAYEHLHEYRTYPGYTERQRLAIEYAERFAVDHHGIDDELFARLRPVRRRRDPRPDALSRGVPRARTDARGARSARGLRHRALVVAAVRSICTRETAGEWPAHFPLDGVQRRPSKVTAEIPKRCEWATNQLATVQPRATATVAARSVGPSSAVIVVCRARSDAAFGFGPSHVNAAGFSPVVAIAIARALASHFAYADGRRCAAPPAPRWSPAGSPTRRPSRGA